MAMKVAEMQVAASDGGDYVDTLTVAARTARSRQETITRGGTVEG